MNIRTLCFGAILFGLTACGFHYPNQTRLGNAMSEIYIEYDPRSQFYKLVSQKLEVRGVKVTAIGKLKSYQKDKNVPVLKITAVQVGQNIVSVNAAGSDLEYGITAISLATLKIPNHSRPIVMRNTITRTTFNKAANTLASNNESDILVRECFDLLSSQLVDRINYLGKMSDPDEPMPNPAELILAKDEDGNEVLVDTGSDMTLLDALRLNKAVEESTGKNISLSELNNGSAVLNANHTYELPRVVPKLVNEAPESVSEEGFLKKTPPEDEEN